MPKQQRCMTSGRKSGFTLIELLVVIAIIAIIAAILFPAFARARENARRASCGSNMKQIGLALMQYSQDYDETYPCGTDSNLAYNDTGALTNPYRSLNPYMKSLQMYRCPSSIPYVAPLAPTATSATSYFFSGVLITPTGRKLAVIPSTAELIAMQEWMYAISQGNLRPQRIASGNYRYWLHPMYANNHFEGSNLLFADGHVKWRKRDSIAAREYGLESDIVGTPSLVNSYWDNLNVPLQDWAK